MITAPSVAIPLALECSARLEGDPTPVSATVSTAGRAGKASRRASQPQGATARAATGDVAWLTIHGAAHNNLRGIDVAFPLGRFTCVTGVSGSGKSTLVSSILYAALAVRIHRARLVPGGHERITGIEHIDKVINVDQSPIGNSPTSTAATYTGLFDAIRELFARMPISKMRGYSINRFSFNRPGGRCEACEGMGQRCIEMHFLPDVWVECESCGGTRYIPETLDVQYRGNSIADVLQKSVREALDLFANVPRVRKMLSTLDDVGLGYLPLGQPAPTLSAGEAQRVKLATELGRPSTGKTLYILDEPTTGLHFDDIKKLLAVLHRLVDLGNTCICIEHNLDVIKTADWVIDLGPEAGDAGGEIVVEGTPEQVAGHHGSHTAKALATILAAGPVEFRMPFDLKKEQARERKLVQSTRAVDEAGPALPWERDGRKWHTVDHVDSEGKPVEWDPAILVWLIETMQSLGDFHPTDWKHRTRIEVTASKGKEWFCHILTRNKDLLDVTIRTGIGTFTRAQLQLMLGLKTLDERTDLPIYGRWARVRLQTNPRGWQQIHLSLRDSIDLDESKFKQFLKRAATSYHKKLERKPSGSLRQLIEPEGFNMQWHLSQRSIYKRKSIRWTSDLLLAIIGKLRSLQPKLDIQWNGQTAVKLRNANTSTYNAKIVTNMARGLRVEIRVPAGQVTPAMIDRLGEDSEVKGRTDHDVVVFWVQSLAQIDGEQLRNVWRCVTSPVPPERLRTA